MGVLIDLEYLDIVEKVEAVIYYIMNFVEKTYENEFNFKMKIF